ncbi:MAG: hypothetical protein RL317_9 [Pseudomonadota bacterium]|jgi:hypothetical protein
MIRNILKGVNDQGYDAGRILWVLSTMCGLGYSGWHLFADHVFSIIEFGTGMGSLILLGGGGVAAKDLGVAKAIQQRGAGQ